MVEQKEMNKECIHCYKIGPCTFELPRYKPEVPRPICTPCAIKLIELGTLINSLTKKEDE